MNRTVISTIIALSLSLGAGGSSNVTVIHQDLSRHVPATLDDINQIDDRFGKETASLSAQISALVGDIKKLGKVDPTDSVRSMRASIDKFRTRQKQIMQNVDAAQHRIDQTQESVSNFQSIIETTSARQMVKATSDLGDSVLTQVDAELVPLRQALVQIDRTLAQLASADALATSRIDDVARNGLGTRSYVVQYGDTLTQLAESLPRFLPHGDRVALIEAANPRIDGNSLPAGLKIELPSTVPQSFAAMTARLAELDETDSRLLAGLDALPVTIAKAVEPLAQQNASFTERLQALADAATSQGEDITTMRAQLVEIPTLIAHSNAPLSDRVARTEQAQTIITDRLAELDETDSRLLAGLDALPVTIAKAVEPLAQQNASFNERLQALAVSNNDRDAKVAVLESAIDAFPSEIKTAIASIVAEQQHAIRALQFELTALRSYVKSQTSQVAHRSEERVQLNNVSIPGHSIEGSDHWLQGLPSDRQFGLILASMRDETKIDMIVQQHTAIKFQSVKSGWWFVMDQTTYNDRSAAQNAVAAWEQLGFSAVIKDLAILREKRCQYRQCTYTLAKS
ncbi:hypothetical protein OAS86_02235 [Gammaproteobacteria bacterium]|nr:hypothetical protein [Gammaproteobacteria bacterium]